MRICFVALEVLGPFSGGGIATALAGQAEHHAANHEVTVLYVNPSLKEEDAPKWEAEYAERNIKFVRAAFETFYPLDNIQKRSFAVKEYLEAWDQEFDVIFFHDYLGLGYYTALTRRLGLGFDNTRIGTVIHGPSEWARSLNMVRDVAGDVTLYELERKQVEYSDFAIGPSEHIFDWCRDQGWLLPQHSRAISNLLPERIELHSGLRPGDRITDIDEIAFFGRLEIRKGFFTFLDAVKYLHKNGLRVPRKITFLGGFCSNGERNSASSVLEYASDWDCEIQFLNNYDHGSAISYLTNNRPLTIIASRDESFGLTAYECLKFGVPVLIADRGALRELAAEPERTEVLFDPKPNVLARRIDAALRDGIVVAGVDPVHNDAAALWDKLLEELEKAPAAVDRDLPCVVTMERDRSAQRTVSGRKKTSANPLVSVILIHHNRPSTFEPALNSILDQTYDNFEVIIVDDGSTAQHFAAMERLVEAASDKRIKVFRQENNYLGAARNFGVSHANGDYLLFMDDDNIAMPEELEVFVKVALATDADVLNAVSRMFKSTGQDRRSFDIYVPVGPSLPLSVFGNTFGDANALVKRSFFEEQGGFTEEYAVGCEDYEFFTRAFLSGARMQLVPSLLFDYRSDDDGMMKELNSGKYIVNQLRGVNAIFDMHRNVDLASIRSIMRVGFYSAVDTEYRYWIDRSVQNRRFPDLETQLANMRYRPNSQAAVEIIVKLMVAYGRVREAVALMERNDVTPDEAMLKHMQRLLSHHERRSVNAGRQSNAILNSNFEFWDLGNTFNGIQPYQYMANEWLMPSSRARDGIVVSQQRDNALFGLSRSRLGTFLQIESFSPDPEGYLFLTQRNTDVGRLLENGLALSFLARASFEGSLTAFMRVTYEHRTENFQDVWPERQGWVSTQWDRLEMSFDLTEFRLEDAKENSLVSLFIKVPTDHPFSLGLTDFCLVPQGEQTQVEPYIRENERQRASEKCFVAGRDARVTAVDGRTAWLALPAAEQARVRPDSRFHIRSGLVVVLSNGDIVEVNCEEAVWDSDGTPENPTPGIRIRLDRDLDYDGSVLDHFMVVTNYLEG